MMRNYVCEFVNGETTLAEAYKNVSNAISRAIENDENAQELGKQQQLIEGMIAIYYMQEQGYYQDKGTGIAEWRKE